VDLLRQLMAATSRISPRRKKARHHAINCMTPGPTPPRPGRWDNTVLDIDLDMAMDAVNDGTNRAIINRVRVTPDIDSKGAGKADTPASGQPVNGVLSPVGRKAYVVNHSGTATEAATAANQHGHAGTITVLDVAKALNRQRHTRSRRNHPDRRFRSAWLWPSRPTAGTASCRPRKGMAPRTVATRLQCHLSEPRLMARHRPGYTEADIRRTGNDNAVRAADHVRS
jgi:hypothetical protein